MMKINITETMPFSGLEGILKILDKGGTYVYI